MRSKWPRAASAASLLLAGILVGCNAQASAPSTASSTTSGGGSGVVAQVASYQLVAGRPGRLLVAMFADDNRWLSFGSVPLSFTYLGTTTSSPDAGVTHESVTATFLPIPGTPTSPDSEPTLTAPADGRGVYGVEAITFDTAGYWRLDATGAMGDGAPFAADASFEVLAAPLVAGIGDPAPASDNAVEGTAGVSPVSIDSRAVTGDPIPDPELHRVSIADALDAHHPALIVFSTPVYCVSRFCGPVTEMVSDLAATYGDRADFIHVEIYEDFEAGKLNQAAIDWLQTSTGDLREPWVFLIDSDGRIAGSWDTMVTRDEIEPLLAALPTIR